MAEECLSPLLDGSTPFKENFDKIGNVADKLGNVFDKLGGVLEAFEQKVKAKALLTIAIALGVLAGALILMSLVPAPKLLVTLAVLKFPIQDDG